MCKRAIPTEWSKYAIDDTIVMKTLKHEKQKYNFARLKETFHITRRKPLNGKFFYSSRRRIGNQSIEHRLNQMDGLDVLTGWTLPALVMGPGQNFLLGMGQFFFGLGRVRHLWFGFGKFPLKMSKIINFFILGRVK